MHIRRLITHITAAASVVGLLSGQAFAELCWGGFYINASTGAVTYNRTFSSTVDKMAINCSTNGSIVTYGEGFAQTVAGVKTVTAKKQGGSGSNGVAVEGLNSSGQQVCVAHDTSADGVVVTVNCPASAVNWRISASTPG